ncbi:class I SAM-dependent DNA methyltransferase [Nocardiopsis sp. NPDC101807]|uniref:class I SAM-dependent DNA methyltransferase n=1 Tax=Nocardiopsis sp. NPDC101807 TaxID=3364339 RepID=UPI0037FE7AC6
MDTIVYNDYDVAADSYDRMARDHNLTDLLATCRRALRHHGTPGRRLLDLGCGTGKGSIPLAEDGFEVTGVDSSARMLEVARAKPGAERVEFVVGDARDLPPLGPFDAVLSTGAVLNYLADENELAAAFRSTARVLAPGGLFVFDMMDRAGAETLVRAPKVFEHEDGMSVFRAERSASAPEAIDLRIDYFFREEGEVWRRTASGHALTIFSPARIESLLAGAGLRVEAHHLPESDAAAPGRREHGHQPETMMIVARKGGASAGSPS